MHCAELQISFAPHADYVALRCAPPCPPSATDSNGHQGFLVRYQAYRAGVRGVARFGAEDLRPCRCTARRVAVHSSGELGIQLATMLHLGAVVPNLGYAADAHYHHLTDDVIEGGKMRYVDGAIAVPTAPGLGVKLNRDKLRRYHELFKELGGYPYDRDPGRPGWYPLIPNARWADPGVGLVPKLR